jgi:hypothetical protein
MIGDQGGGVAVDGSSQVLVLDMQPRPSSCPRPMRCRILIALATDLVSRWRRGDAHSETMTADWMEEASMLGVERKSLCQDLKWLGTALLCMEAAWPSKTVGGIQRRHVC